MVERAEDEEKWLAAGIAGLQQNAFYMHRALVTRSPSLPMFGLTEDRGKCSPDSFLFSFFPFLRNAA